MSSWQFFRSRFNTVVSRSKRKYSEIREAVNGLNCLKKSSPAAASRTPAASSPETTNTNIGDLPDQLLIEILCRLPSSNFVCRCKSVSKRWNTLMADRYFIRRFIQNKKTPALVKQTLINLTGEEFLKRMSTSSSHKPLGVLFQKLMSFHQLKQEPVVVATFNDLVLCGAITPNNCEYYYICNPFTNQWIVVPPPPPPSKVFQMGVYPWPAPTGFICDVPYYKDDDNQLGSGHVEDIQLNAEYNCKVVRLTYAASDVSEQVGVQIFSSDTGEWRELNISIPIPKEFSLRYIAYFECFVCNGMLYWMVDSFKFLIGMDPFTLLNKNHNHQYDFIQIDKPCSFMIQCHGAKGECLKLAQYRFPRGSTTDIYACDVNVDGGQRGARRVSKEMVNVYSLDKMNMMSQLDINDSNGNLWMFSFDPNDADVMFFVIDGLGVSKDITFTPISYNTRTKVWTKMDVKMRRIDHFMHYYPLALPLWPTPLPKLPH